MIDELTAAPFWLAIAKIAWIDVLLSGDNAIVIALAARNLPTIDVLPVQAINVYDIIRRDKLVLTKAAVDALEARFA